MSSSFLVTTLLAVFLAVVLAHDEDFAFDSGEDDDFDVEIDNTWTHGWKSKELTAVAGKVFHFEIPEHFFSIKVDSYEVKRQNGAHLPMWLLFDKIGGIFWGVPLQEDIGTLNLVIRALSNDKNISEEISITILEASDLRDKCPVNEDNTVLTLLIDRGVRAIKPKQRVMAINNVAKFFGLPYSAFTLKPEIKKDDITDSSVVLAGPGNLKARSSKMTALLQVLVGCDGRLWEKTTSLIHQLKQQARDGTISEVIGLPLIGWRVKTETRPILRTKRQLDDYGSGDYEDYYDDNNYDDDDEYDEDNDHNGSTSGDVLTSSKSTTTSSTPTHPHRHHHGQFITFEEDSNQESELSRETIAETIPVMPETTASSTTTTTTTTTTTETETPITSKSTKTTPKNDLDNAAYEYDYDYDAEDNENDPLESKTEVPIFIPTESTSESTTSTTTPTTTISTSTSTATTSTTIEDVPVETVPTTTTTERQTTLLIVEDSEPSTVIYAEPKDETTTSPTSTTTTSLFVTTTEKVFPTVTTIEETEEPLTSKSTTTRQALSSPRTTTTREITESIEYEAKNFPPYIDNRLQQMSVFAGKIFRFVVPINTFNDMEDGHNLTLEFVNSKGEELGSNSWCTFNPARREIYGLPLEEDVSKWEYILRATDRDGATVSDTVSIQVKQHRLQRVVNHEFSLSMRIEKKQEFPHFVDWSLKTLRALGKLYNTNMSEITVRHINYLSEPVVFTWTNDSIPTNECSTEEIHDLYKLLTANDRGDPSEKLSLLLAPQLRVKKVTRVGLGVCETPPAAITPPTNFRPFLRNSIDIINATVGELLVFKVPDDTFYDPEDPDGRTLNISLLTADRQLLKPNSWLQFDVKNREFYGIPRKSGRSEYQLICVDNAGFSVSDSLEVVVYPSAKTNYNVEFIMTVETPLDVFANSASMQRKFVEKLQEIFGDSNASHIQINPFKQKVESTIITWYNKSLSTSNCAHKEISYLESMLKNHDRSISSRVSSIMDPEFPISTIKVLTIGNCKIRPHVPLPPDDIKPPTKVIYPKYPPNKAEEASIDEKSEEAKHDDFQYLMTFIVPAVIIAVMLFLAAIAACVLYRRRRTGKMNVEEDGRQSYGNKGIPVIFQEELDEKPESGNKIPVILKDEKPPLAPPEYSKSGSLKLTDDSEPYQPPPPFTRAQDNGRQPRPKPTPTYRKPPPYVPP